MMTRTSAPVSRGWERLFRAACTAAVMALAGLAGATDAVADTAEAGACPSGTAGRPLAERVPAPIKALVDRMAPDFGLDPLLVYSVISVESAFRVKAVSPKRAQGLMQLIPETADRFGVRDPFDPEQNLQGGMKYLKWLLEHFDGDIRLALAGYNAGEGAVRRHRGVPPYRETRAYVRKIQSLYRCHGGTGRPPAPEEVIALAAVVADGIFDIEDRLEASELSRIHGGGAPGVAPGPLHGLRPGYTGDFAQPQGLR